MDHFGLVAGVIYEYIVEALFSEIAVKVCKKEGINIQTITGESVQCIIHGINDLHKKVIRLLGGAAYGIYQLFTN